MLTGVTVEVKAEIDRLYRNGIRYVFPVHVIDNYFGGTAIYEAEFPRATKYHFGQWPNIVCATRADGISARFTNGWDVIKTFALGDAGGSFPVPSCPAGIGYKNARGLTELGKTLRGPIGTLWDWSAANHEAIIAARMAYDARHSETEEHRPERRYAGAV